MKKSIKSRVVLGLMAMLMLGACSHKSATDVLSAEAFEIKGGSGIIRGELQKPASADRHKVPLVILMHGVTAKMGDSLMVTLADRLQQEGIASIRFNFNGHGSSDGLFEEMTVPKEIDDAYRIYEYAKTLPFVKNISLLGHSQGGVVASMLAGELGADSIKSLVLMAPAAVLKDQALAGTTLGQTFDPNNVPEYIPIFKGLKLGRDYIEEAQKLPIYETAALYHGDVCIIHGTSDMVVDYTYSERYHREYEKSELHLINNGNHTFTYDMKQSVDIAVEFLKKQN